MPHTNFVLGDNWKNVWPDSINVIHEDTYLSRRYIPEHTCKMELTKNGSIYSVWRFSCCGYEYSENITDSGATELPGTICPKCGAKVVS